MGSRWDLRPPPTKFTTDANLKNVSRIFHHYRYIDIQKNNTKYKGFYQKIQRIFQKKYPQNTPQNKFFGACGAENFGGRACGAPPISFFSAPAAPKRGVRLRRTPISFIFSWGRACGAPSSSFFPLGQPQKNKSSFLVWTHVFGDVHWLVVSGGGGPRPNLTI